MRTAAAAACSETSTRSGAWCSEISNINGALLVLASCLCVCVVCAPQGTQCARSSLACFEYRMRLVSGVSVWLRKCSFVLNKLSAQYMRAWWCQSALTRARPFAAPCERASAPSDLRCGIPEYIRESHPVDASLLERGGESLARSVSLFIDNLHARAKERTCGQIDCA